MMGTDSANNRQIRPEGSARTLDLTSTQYYSLNQVSASDIQAFHKCPRKFYLQHILRLGELIDRDPKRASNRGSLIHLLLEWGSTEQAEALFARNQVDEQLAQELLSVVETFQNSQFMQRLQEGNKLVKEHAFYLQLSRNGETPRYLKGFIDALTWQDDGSLLVIDYKTGASRVQSADYQAQADCYALVGLAQGTESVQILMVRPEITDFAGEPEVFSFDYSADQKETLRKKLLTTIEAMEGAQSASLDMVDKEYCKAFCSVPEQLCERRDEL
ncbi:MAG: PD-(D/E)XK nuclease family protein [Coriobacteriia bacterium]|nr:PD-(D/E)XK nuclease family protein [Coriobacteriia bacterium]